ncbi:MAG: hypothetical protein HY862_00590 [Chloroflexi bacterium]|nr:hypothetical protein [Chloroflexota bacterium]
MLLPELNFWDDTRDSLHRASKVLREIRLQVLQPLPHHLHHSLQVVPEGLSTGQLPFGGEFVLDFVDSHLVYRAAGSPTVDISLIGHSQASLGQAASALLAHLGHAITLPEDKLTDTEAFVISPSIAEDYADALYSVFTATARFRARLNGLMSPIALWPHHFDLSFLWFATNEATEQAPHLNFGFAPQSEGLPRPYFYAYAWPIPPGLLDIKLPELAHWHTEGWTGVVVPYDSLRGMTGTSQVIEGFQSEIFQTIAPLLTKG